MPPLELPSRPFLRYNTGNAIHGGSPVTPPPLARADAARLAIFLDFDGCLVDLAPRPQDVIVPRTLTPILHRLRRRTGGALALVSGRPVAALRAILTGPPLAVCGSHGAERSRTGLRIERIEVDHEALADAATRAEAELMGQAGLLLERKPVGLGLHYRGAPGRAAEVHALARRLLPCLPGFHAHAGKMVVELRPDGIGKGHAVRAVMQTPRFCGRTPVVFGDDTTDEPAFMVANRMGGLSVKVGPGVTVARHRLPNPSALRRLLAIWARGRSDGQEERR
jgi:trehalose 6-phosphate phosphatase